MSSPGAFHSAVAAENVPVVFGLWRRSLVLVGRAGAHLISVFRPTPIVAWCS